jgi:hypothetical protein
VPSLDELADTAPALGPQRGRRARYRSGVRLPR